MEQGELTGPDAAGGTEILRFERITRRFFGVRALSDVSFGVRSGQIHAIMGANGAGKSTLMKILVGVHQPDSGRIFLAGSPVAIPNPAAARALGIDIVFQEIELAPNLTVAESLFLSRERTTAGVIRAGEMLTAAAGLMERLGLALQPDAKIETLSVAEMQLVQIARALSADARIIIMDEPTSSLTDVEVERLFTILQGLRAAGHTILYITHKLEEVFKLADTITVLRDGQHVATSPAAEFTRGDLVSMMIGTTRARGLERHEATAPGDPVLEVAALTRAGKFYDISFTAHRGEVLGFFGIVGAGRTEIARCLFGLDPIDSGEIRLDGRPVKFRSSSDAVRAGLALAPEDRKLQGLLLEESLLHNMSLAALPRLTVAGFVSPVREFALAGQYIRALGVVCSNLQQEARNLSGGNQQKVVIAKWLATRPRLLILDEPTKGIDVGAKAEVYQLVRQLAGEGMAVILISSELDEALGLSDRLIVMHEGRVTAELNPTDTTRDEVMRFAVTRSERLPDKTSGKLTIRGGNP
ncbi:MAG TPA: sugar ABC transporter ATP-binding protein [Armatimonadota bacterium]|nr:sugar ABC transporter ATP-binding protein [Armatimonadota bacterium]